MKNVLVTGADGFIGSHLVELLVEKGLNVRSLVQYNSYNNWGCLEDISCKDDIEVILGDIRDPSQCDQILSGVDVVFNLAALIAIPYSYVASSQYIDTNVKGTLNLCEAIKKNNNTKLIQISTSEVYGTAKYVPIDEMHPLQPQSPYSASKIASDAIAQSYNHSFQLPIIVARPFNTYGPRQSSRAIIASIITQILSNKDILELGDLTPTRDFNYVADTCNGISLLSDKEEAIGKTINIGSNTEISIGDLVKKIKNVMNSRIKIKSDDQRLRPKSSEVYQLRCDNSLISKIVNYKPSVSLDDGLIKTIDWFKKDGNLNFYKSAKYTI